MIRIKNICPVCDGEELLEFDEEFYGADFPWMNPGRWFAALARTSWPTSIK